MRFQPFLGILFWFTVARGQQPALMIPLGHTADITTACFSADGKYLVTGSLDRSAIIWETGTGRKIQELGGFRSSISYVAWSPAGNYIAVGTDSTLTVWSSTGYKIVYSSPLIASVLFSPDSKKLFLQDFAGMVRQQDIATGKVQYTYRDSAELKGMNRSPDGRFFCSYKDKTFRVRETKTGRLFAQRNVNGKILDCFFSGDSKYLVAVSTEGLQRFNTENGFQALNFIENTCDWSILSGNQQFLLTVTGTLHPVATLWDLQKYRISFNSGNVIPPGDSVAVFDVNDGTIKGFQQNPPNSPFPFPVYLNKAATSVSNDGKFIRAPGFLWNTAHFEKGFSVPAGESAVAAFSEDGSRLIVQQEPGIPVMLDTENGNIIRQYKAGAENIRFAELSPDGSQFMVYGYDSTVRIIETATAKTLTTLEGHWGQVLSAHYNTRGKTILTNAADSTAKLWDAGNGRLLNSFQDRLPGINPAFFNNEDSIILPGYSIDSAQVFDMVADTVAATGQFFTEIRAEWGYKNLFYSLSGRYRLRATVASITRLSDSFGENRLDFDGLYSAVAFSQDEKLLALADAGSDSLIVYDIEGHRRIAGVSLHMDSARSQFTRGILQVLFTPDRLIVVDGSALIHFLSLKDAHELYTLPGYSVSVSADFKRLIVGNQGRCDLYDLEKRKLLYHYIAVDHENYLVVDSLYRFDGTEAAVRTLYYVCGNEVIDLEQVKKRSWEPALAAKATKVSTERYIAKTISQADVCNYAPRTESKGFSGGNFNFRIIAQRGGVGEVQVFVNQKMVRRYSPHTLRKQEDTYYLAVPQREVDSFFIVGSENQVTVRATTTGGDVSSKKVVIRDTADADELAALRALNNSSGPDLYLLSVGISQYGNPKISLNFPAGDASAFSALMERAAGKLLNGDGKQHVFSWTINGNAVKPTKTEIWKLMELIRQRAKPADIVLLFFAGHGVTAQGGEDLLLPMADATSLKDLEANTAKVAISFREIIGWLRSIRANKEIVILDVCNAAIVGKQLGPVRSRDLSPEQQIVMDNLSSATGSCVLAAASEGQKAYETSLYDHGLLTQALLESIKLRTSLHNGKYIRVDQWFGRAVESVTAMAGEIKARQDPKVFGNAAFNIGIADQEVADSIHLSLRKKIFSLVNIVIEGPNPLDSLSLSAKLRDRLNGVIAPRGEGGYLVVEGNALPGSWRLTGTYSVNQKTVNLHLFLAKNDLQGGTEYAFAVKGNTDDSDAVADSIVAKINGYLAGGTGGNPE